MVSDKAIGAVTTMAAMPYRLYLLCAFVLLGRPQDVLTFLQPLRPGLVLTLLATAAMVFSARREELSAALSTSESKRYLLFYIIMVLGIPFAAHKGVAFQSVLQTYLTNVLFFALSVSQITSLQRLKTLAWVISLSTVMYGVFGGLLQSGGGGRFSVLGDAFDPNDTAYVLLALFPLCLFFVRFDEGLFKKLTAIAAIVGAVATILQTGSRGGLLGLATVLLIALLTKMSGLKMAHKLLLVVMLASVFFLVRDRIDVERYSTLFDLSSDYNVTAEGGRVELWRGAIDLAFSNPITGVGVECYPYAYLLARQRADKSYLAWKTVHNSYLQVACEVGLIGFSVFLLINVRSLLTFIRIGSIRLPPGHPAASQLRALAGLMLLGFTGLLVSAFFLSQGYSIFSTLYFALAAAVGRIEPGLSRGIGFQPVEGTNGRERRRRPLR